jgi:hypothetical protein
MTEQRLRDVIELVNEIIVEATRFTDQLDEAYSDQDPEVLAIQSAARKSLINHLQRVFGGLSE